jgi:hypothetical protein
MPNVGEVAGQLPWNDEHGIDPDDVSCSDKSRRQAFRGHCYAAQAIFVERPG